MNELKVVSYGTKPVWLKIKKLFKVRRHYIPLCISRGCFAGSNKEMVM